MSSPQSPDSPRGFVDVRMRGFPQRASVEEAQRWLDQLPVPELATERLAISEAAHRVLAEPVSSQVPVPGFERAMMDGYAVRAADTQGARRDCPRPFQLVGESWPGRPSDRCVGNGESIQIMTGAPLPAGANAVVPAEEAVLRGSTLQVFQELADGKHVGRCGEDVQPGEMLMLPGRCLRPQDLGLLAATGQLSVTVFRRPSVHLIITGSEIVAADGPCGQFQVRDANGPMLQALLERDHGHLGRKSLISDVPQSLGEALREPADVVLVSVGSSVGLEDYAASQLAQHGHLAYHGIAMRPGGPTGLGTLDQRVVFLLPGNPVSCLCAYDFFAGRYLRRLTGQSCDWPYRHQDYPLAVKLCGSAARVDYIRVSLRAGKVHPLPYSGGSQLSSATRSDGFVLLPQGVAELAAETPVTVYLYDR